MKHSNKSRYFAKTVIHIALIRITVDNVKIVQYAPDDGMPHSKDLIL